MTNRYMKLLGATTALVAFASTTNAATTLSTVTDTTVLTSVTTGGININATGGISVTSGPALTISNSTAANNLIQVSSTGVIRAGGTGAVISASDVGAAATVSNGAIVINNSGTIAAVGGNTKAIDLSNGTANGVTINNAGTISGSVTLGAGNDSLTVENGTLTGDISLDAGANSLTISSSTVNNATTTAANGVNTVTINNGSVVSSSITLGNGGNVVTVNNATLKTNNGAALTLGSGDDTLTVSNSGVISGSIAFGGGTGDKMLAYGTYSTGGAITGLENLYVSGTTNVGHSIGGAAVTLGSTVSSTVNFNAANSIGALVTNGGGNAVNFTGGTVTGTTFTGAAGSKIGFSIVSNTNAGANGRYDLSGGALNYGNTSVTVNLSTGAGYIASGTSFILGTGSSAASAVTSATNLTASSNGVYRYDLANSGNNVVLTVRRVATSSVLNGSSYQTIGNVLDNLGANASNTMVTVQGLIGQQSSAAGVQNVVESLSPANLDGLGAAGVGFNTQTGNLVSNRLASLRSGTALKGIATGDAADVNHMWVEGFGNHTEQDDRNGQRGYTSNGGGATIGFDTDTLVDGMTTGAAISYAKGKVESNAYGGAETDIDTYAGTLYGSHVLGDGTFINAQLGGGYNKYDSSRNIAGIGTAKGDFNGWQATAKAEAGKDFAVSGFTLTPLASLQGTYLNVEDYTETGAGGASLHVDTKSLSALDAGLGGQAAYALPLENGGVLKPTARAKYIYRMGDTNMQSTSNFTGGGASFATNGVKADRGSLDLGAGLLLTTASGVDFSLNYDADIRSSLTGHTGQVKARWAF